MANADLVIGNGLSNLTISVSDSTPMMTRAQDATTAILAAFSPSTQTFKVTWGFMIVAGFNDTLIHAFNLNGSATNVSTTIPAGDYTSGGALAAAITAAQTASEALFSGGARGTISCTYDEGTGKFSWTWTELRATISQFIIRGTPASYATQAISTVGVTLGGAGITGSGASGTVTANNEVRVHRFAFVFGGAAGSVRMADAAFTAEAFFGITATTNKTILFYLTELDMLDPEPPPPPVITVVTRSADPSPRASVGIRIGSPILIPKAFTPEEAKWWEREMHPAGPADLAMKGYREALIKRTRAFGEGETAERGRENPTGPADYRKRLNERTRAFGEGETGSEKRGGDHER